MEVRAKRGRSKQIPEMEVYCISIHYLSSQHCLRSKSLIEKCVLNTFLEVLAAV